MRVFLVGEAASHRDDLLDALPEDIANSVEVLDLPREAAHDATYDHRLTSEDIIVSLRLNRGGAPLPRTRMLHVPGAGLDGIDLKALHPDTILCNVFEHEIPISEFTIGSMLDWEIDFESMRRSFTPETWSDIYRHRVPHGEIHGKTLVILGYGRIGQTVAKRAAAFGMRVIAVDPNLAGTPDPNGIADRIITPTQLAVACELSDYLVVTCPLSDESKGIVDEAVLSALGSGGVLINVSRAEVVNEDDLHAALSANIIRGASLDVWYRYPKEGGDHVAPARQDFHALPNVRATPHSSAWTHGLSKRRYAVIAQNIEALVRSGSFRNRISLKA